MAGVGYETDVGLAGGGEIEDRHVFSTFEQGLKLIESAAVTFDRRRMIGSGRFGESSFRNGKFHKERTKKRQERPARSQET